MQVIPESYTRLSGTASDVRENLGPLADLAGKWVGSKGWNLVALPSKGSTPSDEGDFKLLLQPYTETIVFTPIGGAVRNRGGDVDQFVTGLMYELTVSDTETNETLHVENGMWLYLDNVFNNDGTAGPKPPFSLARSATIPHGDSAMILGNASETNGSPSFPVQSALPPDTGPNTPLGYTDDYSTVPQGTPFVSADVNKTLEADIAGQDIVHTTTFVMDSKNSGGITNIPFIVDRADTPRFETIFWIETVKEADGSTFLQLQYTQISDIIFHKKFGKDGLITWPHVNVNTLKKV
jgi:hypothetical protein